MKKLLFTGLLAILTATTMTAQPKLQADNIDEVLRAYGIRHLFKGIIESAVVGVRKPNPTLFRLGVDALELPAAQVLVVGDSLRKDIEPAESLGCPALWLKGKGWTPDEDARTHPHTITHIAQVLKYVP